MIAPPKPADEQDRLAALHALQILHTKTEQRYDRITQMATRVLNVPIALVTLIAENEQWFKSCVGMEGTPTPRDVSFCAHAILRPQIMVVEDATQDERFADNPQVIGPPFIRFYAGRPLAASNGQRVGTLCIVDTKPRKMSMEELRNLNDLGAWAEREMNSFDREEKHLEGVLMPPDSPAGADTPAKPKAE